MTVSATKLEANRRNAQRSCGPRTTAGKNCSKLNAVTHSTAPRRSCCSTKIVRRSKTGERPGSIALCLRMTLSAASSTMQSCRPGM